MAGQRHLEVEAFIDDKGLHRPHILDLRHFLRKKLEQAEILAQHGSDDQVELAGNNTNTDHPEQLAELLPLLDQLHALDPHSHHDNLLIGQGLRVHQATD